MCGVLTQIVQEVRRSILVGVELGGSHQGLGDFAVSCAIIVTGGERLGFRLSACLRQVTIVPKYWHLKALPRNVRYARSFSSRKTEVQYVAEGPTGIHYQRRGRDKNGLPRLGQNLITLIGCSRTAALKLISFNRIFKRDLRCFNFRRRFC